ncbi:hypothetical protein RUM43_003761 [Polyplax serrata]|uniref:PDZ domain-containing protein n=1 Tax=Polyplax serrata TaxID=468196 RepID=A0AAN8NXB9_POLSC
MFNIWQMFYGDLGVFDPNGTPIGSYEEVHALFSSSRVRNSDWSSFVKSKYAYSLSTGRRYKRSRVNAKDMGSNVSRHSGKGMSGRRAQSSGSLYRMLAPRVGKVLNRCGDGVRQRDRNKFCGSLPNYLDEKQVFSEGNDPSPESLYYPSNTYEKIYQKRSSSRATDRLFCDQQEQVVWDQGYGSEWSPEEEHTVSANSTFRRKWSTVRRNSDAAFISKENTFEAKLAKGSRGLGLSVTGGIDTADEHPGLIRIKRIFPHQPAWECGILELGDVILEVNGTPLTGLSNHEALEVLRTASNDVVLKVCRPPSNTFYIPTAGDEQFLPLPPPPPPKRDPNRNVLLSSQSSNSTVKLNLPFTEFYGEFDVVLNKINGSLGFTLRKEDESILGHYVRTLVREPAMSDGRIRPGDKIVSVNGVDISPMSHSEAVAFLRQSGDEVKLRLYRDPAQTPVAALSPTESHKSFRPRPVLRKEAMDMLNTLAVRKLSPKESRNSGQSISRLQNSSPKSSSRRRKLTKTPHETEMFQSKMERVNCLELNEEDVKESDQVDCEFEREEPTSLPLMSISTSEFTHKNPVYQSAHPSVRMDCEPGIARLSDQNVSDSINEQNGGSRGLLKWKGVVFTKGSEKAKQTKGETLTIELCRGWNSRLGFSLTSSHSKTLISAIYPDSVAARDGRLRVGDEVIMINDESTNGMTTNDVIDLLRKVRGAIAITIVRGDDDGS